MPSRSKQAVRRPVPYDRNVRIRHAANHENRAPDVRRSKRKSIPATHYNYGQVKCCICQKSFRGDIDVTHFGRSVCSVECLRLADIIQDFD